MDYKKIENEAFAGLLSGIVTRFLFSPFDVVKIRLQNQAKHHYGKIIHSTSPMNYHYYNGTWDAVAQIYKYEGIQGLWKGTVPGIVLWGSFAAIEFPIYKQLLRTANLEADPGRKTSNRFKLVETFLCGGIAALIAQIITFPIDTLRTKVISTRLHDSHYHLSLFQHVRAIQERHGIYRGFYSGILPTMLQVVPNASLTFMFYETLDIGLTLTDESSFTNKFDYMVRGGISGFLAKFILYPFDTIKKRLQLNGSIHGVPLYRNTLHCITDITQNEGVSSFYKGLVPQLFKTFFSTGSTFLIFETVNTFLATRRNEK